MVIKLLHVCTDTRTTQWEDPRLSNPKIAGQAIPYSRDYKRKYEYFKSNLKRPVSQLLNSFIYLSKSIKMFCILIFRTVHQINKKLKFAVLIFWKIHTE